VQGRIEGPYERYTPEGELALRLRQLTRRPVRPVEHPPHGSCDVL
jgi:hypothetical protein